MFRRMRRDLFHRWEGNPILTPDDFPFPCNSVFNGTPAKLGDGDYVLLVRIEGRQGYSFFALARSRDGLRWRVDERPALLPAAQGPFAKYEALGIEDPRATWIDGAWHVLYTAYSGYGPRIALARTHDFVSFERVAVISQPGNKDGVLFPEKIGGEYVRLDRPIGNDVGSIWISRSKDLIHWGRPQVLATPRPGYWDSFRVGASVPPFRTSKGWLEIYHGTRMTSAGPIYRAGGLLLDIEDPSRVLARSAIPLLSPREEYERIGDIPNVVFASGALVEPDGEVKLYYGAADTSICVATAYLDDILDHTIEYFEHGPPNSAV